MFQCVDGFQTHSERSRTRSCVATGRRVRVEYRLYLLSIPWRSWFNNCALTVYGTKKKGMPWLFPLPVSYILLGTGSEPAWVFSCYYSSAYCSIYANVLMINESVVVCVCVLRMGLMLSRWWLVRRRQGLQYVECSTEDSDTHSLQSSSSHEGNGYLVPQAPFILDGGSPIQKLPQDLILK